eukprot:3804263-Amphidinium_carterae.1
MFVLQNDVHYPQKDLFQSDKAVSLIIRLVLSLPSGGGDECLRPSAMIQSVRPRHRSKTTKKSSTHCSYLAGRNMRRAMRSVSGSSDEEEAMAAMMQRDEAQSPNGSGVPWSLNLCPERK